MGMKRIAATMMLAGVAWAQADDSVIRITTSLVQIDAIVTDKDGKLVTDLTAADFEIFQDTKKRDVTAFSVVRVASGSAERAVVKGAIPPPQVLPQGVAREQVRRTVAILVDDLNIEYADLARVRQAVAKFVAEDLRAGDLAAIVTTQGGMGVYSQFTTNRALLAEAANKLVWSQRSEIQAGSFQNVASEEIRMLRAGSFAAIRAGIQGMRNMPGRKSIVLFSAGTVSSDPGDPLLESLANEATRAAVTIYAIYPGGVQSVSSVPPGSAYPQTVIYTRPLTDPRGTPQDPESLPLLAKGDMSYLAERTGGLHFNNDNNLRDLLVQALEDQSSYYLLGYNPGKESFDRKFHKINVRVTRPGLTVRSRTGYVGVEDTGRRELKTAGGRMTEALLGPFQANDLHTRLAATFRSDGNKPRIMSQLWIDGKDLTFDRQDDGKFHTEIHVHVASFDPQGRMQDHAERGYRVSLTEEQLSEARRSGLLYSISYPVTKPGAYHVRVAVRENSTEHVGTASQFLISPDIGKERLALSGIIVKGYEDEKRSDDLAKPWLVLLRLGRGIEWEAQVYHPKLAKGTPRLTAALRLYRDGELVKESKPEPVYIREPLKKKQIDVPVSGTVLLSETYAPGEYVLQLIVTDENDKAKTVTQAIGFQVAP